MNLYIKNMVSNRCKMIVKSELEKLGLTGITVDLGEVEIIETLSEEQQKILNARLKKAGLTILEDKKSILVEKIKVIIIDLLYFNEKQLKINLSDYIIEKTNHNYNYLANIFQEKEHTTIENFLLSHKTEMVKELLIYSELNINEIADKLHYSSAAHLSNQFKKMTGMSPSQYKHLKHPMRMTIENV